MNLLVAGFRLDFRKRFLFEKHLPFTIVYFFFTTVAIHIVVALLLLHIGRALAARVQVMLVNGGRAQAHLVCKGLCSCY